MKEKWNSIVLLKRGIYRISSITRLLLFFLFQQLPFPFLRFFFFIVTIYFFFTRTIFIAITDFNSSRSSLFMFIIDDSNLFTYLFVFTLPFYLLQCIVWDKSMEHCGKIVILKEMRKKNYGEIVIRDEKEELFFLCNWCFFKVLKL